MAEQVRPAEGTNRWWCAGAASAALALAGFGSAVHAQVSFTDVGPARGIQAYHMALGMGGGIAAADFDDDGDVDLFVPNAAGFPNQLYRNVGNGSFEEIAAQAGLDNVLRARAAVWFDYDGDQRLDLLVAGDCWGDCQMQQRLWLYRQVADAQFVDTTAAAGLDVFLAAQEAHQGGIAAGDINNDGYLDVVLGIWAGDAIVLLNNTDGTFTDISDSSGITAPTGVGGTFAEGHWQPMFHDFDGDGWQDLLFNIDFTPNHLWINQHDNTFVDVAPAAGIDTAFNEMGLTLGDFDNDGDFDAYMTNITTVEGKHSVLFRNDSTPGSLLFTEISQAAGVDDGGWGWGTTFGDFDNDSRLDLIATNGWGNPPYDVDTSRFWQSAVTEGSEAFIDSSAAVGFDDSLWGSGLIAVDFDRDGDLDIIQTTRDPFTGEGPLRLLSNSLWNPKLHNAYLVVRPRMDGPNHWAIGAIVRATVAGRTCSRLISAGTSFLSQEPAEAFIGQDVIDQFDEVRVEWPDGRLTILDNVAKNQVITISPCPIDLDGDGRLGVGDFFAFVAAFAAGDPTADIDGSGSIDVGDFFAFITAFAAGC